MRKNFIVPFLVFCLITICVFAQKERTRNWYFGTGLGLQVNDTLVPSLLPNSQVLTPGGCASMSDAAGQLLFYTNGETIWNANHVVMLNGASLAGSGNASQSSLIVPLVTSANEYFVFTISDSCSNSLHYSVVDMLLDGGLGGVSLKNIPLGTNMIQKITGTVNSTGTGYWIIVHQYLNNAFYAYPVSSGGVGNPVTSNVGTVVNSTNCIGTLKASPTNNKLAMVFPGSNNLEVYSFDNSTGIVFNAMSIGNTLSDPTYGCEFSSDGRYLYTNSATSGITPPSIFQYDVSLATAQAIDASKVQVGFSQNPFVYTTMQLGLDGKIYCAGTNRTYISWIQQPQNAGFGCNYVENPFFLGGNTSQYGLPNFLSSYLYSTVGISNATNASMFSVYPNPAKDFIVVKVNGDKNFKAEIIDLTGRIITAPQEKQNNKEIKINLQEIAAGVYFAKANDGNKESIYKFVINR